MELIKLGLQIVVGIVIVISMFLSSVDAWLAIYISTCVVVIVLISVKRVLCEHVKIE